MQWEKRGHVFTPSTESWMHAYAQVPTPIVFDNFIRVYVGCRPRNQTDPLPISQIGYVDLARMDPTQVLRTSAGPVLSLGGMGCFDEFGLHPLSAVQRGDEIWLYYVGWTRMTSVPFNRSIGLAVSKDHGETFVRVGRGPILGPTYNEPFLQQGPSVRFLAGEWHMWYLSGIAWVTHRGRAEAIYQMMHATSDDGIQWARDGKPCMPTVRELECQAGQSVIERNGRYHMWFSFRRGIDFRNADGGYRLGYATSSDLVHWERDDASVGMAVSDSGWDSEMLCYPSIIECDGRTMMFYCGNYFGKKGFGLAELSTP